MILGLPFVDLSSLARELSTSPSGPFRDENAISNSLEKKDDKNCLALNMLLTIEKGDSNINAPFTQTFTTKAYRIHRGIHRHLRISYRPSSHEARAVSE